MTGVGISTALKYFFHLRWIINSLVCVFHINIYKDIEIISNVLEDACLNAKFATHVVFFTVVVYFILKNIITTVM